MTQLKRCFLPRPLRVFFLAVLLAFGASFLPSASRSLLAQDKSGVVDVIPAPQEPKAAATPTPIEPRKPDSSPKPPSKPGDYSQEALIFESMVTRFKEQADGTGTEQTTVRARILADAGVKQMAVQQFTYIAGNQQIDIAYVRVVKPDGTVVVTPAYNVQDLPADITRTAPMYSDIHQKHVAVKGLGVGDTLEYQVTLTTLKPEVPGHFWFEYSFQKDLIALDEQVFLDLPADKAVNVATAADSPQPAINTANGRKLFHWSSNNLARPDPDAPAKSTRHWKPSIQVTTFSSWQQIGEWYASLQRSSLEVTPAVAARAASLTKGLTSDEDKVQAIFNDVALHIHYVGLEFGIGRYQPHPADDVLSNEYGDCKDKHTLLAAELKAAGIEAWPVLISAGRELDPATPSPSQFNHVITLVPLKGKMLWMDSTEEVAPIGVLMMPLRDKQALAIPDNKPPYLERTPAVLPFTQSTTFKAEGKLDGNGRFTGHITQSYLGDVALLMRAVLRQVAPSQLKPTLQQFSSNEGFGGEISNPQISNVEEISRTFKIDWDYTREKFGEWDDQRITPAMPGTGLGAMPGVKVQKPGDDVELGSPGMQDFVSVIQLADGWQMVPPDGVTRNEDWAEYRSTYQFQNGVYTAERIFIVKKTVVPLADWDKYLAFRRAIYADEVQTSVLYRGSTPGGSATDQTPRYPSRAAMSAVFQQISASVKPAHDADEILEDESPIDADALTKADAQAKAAVESVETATAGLNPKQFDSLYWMQGLSYAWSELGIARYRAKDLAAAEAYLRAAWQLSQDKRSGYWLGRVLEAKGNKVTAAHQLQLARVTAWGSGLVGLRSINFDEEIDSEYARITGQGIKATPLNGGQYSGSLREQLDKQLEVHPILAKTKLNGTAFFTLAFQNSKAMHATWMGGDKELESLAHTLETHPFPVVLPPGSKAVLLREARVICTPWAGCDANLLLPTANALPPIGIQPQVRTTLSLRPNPAQ